MLSGVTKWVSYKHTDGSRVLLGRLREGELPWDKGSTEVVLKERNNCFKIKEKLRREG